MNPCSDDALKLDYINEALSERERTTLESHLATCPACRQEIGELRKTAALFAGLTLPSPPLAWTEATKARLRAKGGVPAAVLPARAFSASTQRHGLQYAGIAVAAVAGLALLFRLVMPVAGQSVAALGVSEPQAARTVALVAWCLALHALILVPSIIDDMYLLAQAGCQRRRGLQQGLH